MPHISRHSFGKQALSGVSGIAFLASFPLFGHRHSSWGAPAPTSSIPISGRYPHLAMFNHSLECGTGAVVPWADRLWVVTYSPHRPGGSDDGLYEITPELEIVKRKESIGGTPACRMIHRESNQLFIGPYAIDQDRKVRPISYAKMRGRLTAIARHLTNPETKIYYLTMEEGVYEVDVHTLEVRKLFKDQNEPLPGSRYRLELGTRTVIVDRSERSSGGSFRMHDGDRLPGWHGKGGYTGQGQLVYANNGTLVIGLTNYFNDFTQSSGCLATWNGRDRHWEVVETRQFTEVTGPGGIEGNTSQESPVWAMGWDYRSSILKLLDGGEWSTYRLPKGSYSNGSLSGTLTEWFRIRQVGPDGQYLMDQHGMWFDFPGDFSKEIHRAPAPIGVHLKANPDFARWQDRLVFGCFGAPRKGSGWEGAKQAHSNLWFTRWEHLKQHGQPYGFGGPWLLDIVKAGDPSEPYAFSGFKNRQLHLSHKANQPISFQLEIDRTGRGVWEHLTTIRVPPFGYTWHTFPDQLEAEWIRLIADRDGHFVTAYFHYGSGGGAVFELDRFRALAPVSQTATRSAGLLRARGEDRGTLEFAAWTIDDNGKATEVGYYEIGPEMTLRRVNDPQAHTLLKEAAKIEESIVAVDQASVVITVPQGRRYRLPKGDPSLDQPTKLGARVLRGENYHKSLLNVCGTFFSLPHPASGGVAHISPIATHHKRIADFCAWRGLVVMSGCRNDLDDGAGEHFVPSDDGKVGLWFGDMDDLWKMGKPTGIGGPWKDTPIRADTPSDPYLMTGFDKKNLTLSHDSDRPVTFTLEVDFAINIRTTMSGDDYMADGIRSTPSEFDLERPKNSNSPMGSALTGSG